MDKMDYIAIAISSSMDTLRAAKRECQSLFATRIMTVSDYDRVIETLSEIQERISQDYVRNTMTIKMTLDKYPSQNQMSALITLMDWANKEHRAYCRLGELISEVNSEIEETIHSMQYIYETKN